MSEHVLRLTVDLEREQRWRVAAASRECSFEARVQRLLDAAASGALRAPGRPDADPRTF
ncbi:MAG: hypothetical protein ACTHMY_10535 [Solirubrobacteraceae bacterium]